MARKTIYKTNEQKQDANRRNCKKYYYKNRKTLREKKCKKCKKTIITETKIFRNTKRNS
jgi:hypothetical protein